MGAQTVIDYGANRVRLVEFDGSGRKLRLLGVREVPLEVTGELKEGEDPDDARAHAIAAAMDDGDFATDPSGLAFPSAQAMSREFDLPFTARDQIEKVVKFESESHFPGDIDDVVVQHLVLRQSRDKSHLLAVAVRKDDLLDRLDILEESGLDPMFTELDDFALYNALQATGAAAETGERAVVVNAQDVTTSLLFLQGGKLYAVRSIRIGAASVRHVAAPPAEGAAAEADDARAREVETARTHDFLARLTREIRRTLGTLPDFGEPGKVLLLGSGARLAGFAEAMGQAFGAPAEELDLLDRVDHKLSDADAERFGPDLGVALGVAYKLNGIDETRTDFRRDEAAYTRKFDQVKTPLIVLSFLLFLCVAFLGLDKFMEARKVRQEFDRIIGTAREALAAAMEGDLKAAQARVPTMTDKPREVQALLDATKGLREEVAQKLGRSNTIPDMPSALNVWIQFSKLIRANESELGRFALDRIDIEAMGKEPVMHLKGEVEDAAKYQKLIDLLGTDPMFAGVTPGGTRATNTGTLKFEDVAIKLNLSGAAEVKT
jgi:Tfp pilus assembly PilM family ATPase